MTFALANACIIDVSTPYNPLLLPDDMDVTCTATNSDESAKKAKFTEEQATELMQVRQYLFGITYEIFI